MGCFFVLIQSAFRRDGLSQLWNELVKDGEVVSNTSESLTNSAGVAAKKGWSRIQLKVSRSIVGVSYITIPYSF